MDEPDFGREPVSIRAGGIPDSPDCAHPTLRPCWEEAPEGAVGLITSYWCDVCGTPFTPDEADEVRRARRVAA
jgi:hypothetical protein